MLVRLRDHVDSLKTSWLQNPSFNPNRRYERDMSGFNESVAPPSPSSGRPRLGAPLVAEVVLGSDAGSECGQRSG